MRSTNDVLDHHLEAIKQGDVNAVLSGYAPDAISFIIRSGKIVAQSFTAKITPKR